MLSSRQPQYEVRFRLDDGKPWRGEQGRDLVANLFQNDPHKAISPLFHHTADGSFAQGVPTIRFRGGHGFFAIVAVGQSAIDHVQAIEHVIRRAIADRLNRPIRTESMDTDVALTLGERARVYRAHLVVFARKHSAMKTKFEWPDDQLTMYLRGMALRDIRTQANALGLDLPQEHFPFQILDIGRRGRVPLNKPGQALYCGYVKHVDFLTTLNLKGHWTLGGLQNRGYGSIRPYRRQRADLSSIPKVSGDSYAQL